MGAAANIPSGITRVPSTGVANIPASANNLNGGGQNVPSISSGPSGGTIYVWYTAQNIDGTNNSSMVDSTGVAAWTNLGITAGASLSQATAANQGTFRASVPTKLNGKSAVQCLDAVRSMLSATAFAAIPQPFLMGFVWRTDKSSVQIVSSSSPIIQVFTAAGGTLQVNAGAGAKDTTLNPTANQFHMATITFNGASSSARLDGVAGAAISPGTNGFGGTEAFLGASSLGIIGYAVEFIIASVGTDLEGWFTGQYGSFPQ